MMTRRRRRFAPHCAAAVVWLATLGLALAKDPNPVPVVPHGDAAMSAAFARAAATLDDFLAAWRAPPPGAKGFAVKIGLMDAPAVPGYVVVRPDSQRSGIVEWFWASDLKVEGDGFSARLGDEPESLSNVVYGQRVHFARADIGDWMYWRDGKIVGNATACPALARASAEERRRMKEDYGIDCE
jgi:uncharacterized protein YegJ (DUF2314 family)